MRPDAGTNLGRRADLLSASGVAEGRVLGVLMTDGEGRPLEAEARGFTAFVAGDRVPSAAAQLAQSEHRVSVTVVVDAAVAGRTLAAVRHLETTLGSVHRVETVVTDGELVGAVAEAGSAALAFGEDGEDGGEGEDGGAIPVLRIVWLVTGRCTEPTDTSIEALAADARQRGYRIVSTGTGDATPAWLERVGPDWRYDPTELGFTAAVADTAETIAGIWLVAVEAPADATVDLRFTGEGVAHEFTHPTQR